MVEKRDLDDGKTWTHARRGSEKRQNKCGMQAIERAMANDDMTWMLTGSGKGNGVRGTCVWHNTVANDMVSSDLIV